MCLRSMKNVCRVLGLRLESTHLWEYEKNLIYENVHFKSKAQHAPVCDNSTYAPRAQFTHVPICVLHHVSASPLTTVHAKGSCVQRFCRTRRRFPLQSTVSHGCNQLCLLPTPAWQTEHRMCLGKGVIFNSCGSTIRFNLQNQLRRALWLPPLWTSSW